MQQRLIIVYNASSDKLAKVNRKVLKPARELGGKVQVGKYKVGAKREDAEGLSRLLANDDIVVAAEGGHVAEVAINGAILSGKRIWLAVMKIGKFKGVGRISKLKKALTNAVDVSTIKVVDCKHGVRTKKR